jgi:hypothetical protein
MANRELKYFSYRAMPQIYLARFRQPPFAVASAHWAIFLPEAHTTFDSSGIPTRGSLFHARKDWINAQEPLVCSVQGLTHYECRDEFPLHTSPILLDCHCLKDTDVTAAQLAHACTQTSEDRSFNYFTRNCQQWVKEVIDYLVTHDVVSVAVYAEMESRGYKTLKEESVDKSLSLCARGRRRKG